MRTLPGWGATLLFLSWLAVSGCDSAEEDYGYEAPTLLTPDRAVYYSTERYHFEWELPEGATGTELTTIYLDDFYDPNRHRIRFDTTGVTRSYLGGDHPQQVDITGAYADAEEPMYLGYRVRAVGPLGRSRWTEVRSLVIRPISELTRIVVEAHATFEFESEQGEAYYSGVATSAPIDFASAVEALGYNPASVRVVRPETEGVGTRAQYLGPDEERWRDFDRLVLGFGGESDNEPDFPFEALGGTPYSGPTPPPGSTVYFGDASGQWLNLTQVLLSEPRLHMAYFLEPEADEGTPHWVRVVFQFETFIEG